MSWYVNLSKRGKVILWCAVAFIFASGLLNSIKESNTSTETTAEQETEEVELEEETTEEEEEPSSIEFEEVQKIEEGYYSYTYHGGDALTLGTMERTMYSTTFDILKQEFEANEDAQEISVSYKVPSIDQYGNESMAQAGHITILRETFEKINEDNFRAENLWDIAEQSVLHPDLR